jgi:hypothetical protein
MPDGKKQLKSLNRRGIIHTPRPLCLMFQGWRYAHCFPNWGRMVDNHRKHYDQSRR